MVVAGGGLVTGVWGWCCATDGGFYSVVGKFPVFGVVCSVVGDLVLDCCDLRGLRLVTIIVVW